VTELSKGFTEDLRRFGLVLLGAGVLTPVEPAFRILAISGGLILLMTAYITITVTGGKS
jgi:hypothetical protein